MPTIDKEFQSLIPPPSDDEYKQLEVNILTDGCRDPISLWGDIILDGHNRFKICQEHNISFNTVQIEVASRDEAMLWIVQNQLGRRNLTPQQVSYFRGGWHARDKLTKVEVASIAGATNRQNDGWFPSDESQDSEHSPTTAERIAQQTGVSPRTIERDAVYAQAIDDIADVVGPEARTAILTAGTIKTKKDVLATAGLISDAPDLVTEIVQGEKTVEQAKQELRARSNPTPVDRFKVLYADPDWESKGAGALRAMGQDIQDQSEDDSVLFLWVPSRLLEKAFGVVRAWGFEYKASFVRDLGNGPLTGRYNHINHEFLLVCTRGDCEARAPELFGSIVQVSVKAQVKELIDLMYPDGRRFDLFDRDGEWFVEEEETEESQSDEGF